MNVRTFVKYFSLSRKRNPCSPRGGPSKASSLPLEQLRRLQRGRGLVISSQCNPTLIHPVFLSLSLCISLVSFSFLIESRVNHDEICHTPGGKNNRCHSGRRTTASNLLFDINGGCDRDKRSTWARLSLPSFFLKLPQKYESNYDGEPSIRRIHSW